MEENFEEIVRRYYNRLRDPFVRRLTRKYPTMRLDEAEDLYQEAFIAVQDNIKRGNVRPDTNWNSYILTIGMNMASKEYRDEGTTINIGNIGSTNDDDDSGLASSLARKVEDIIKEMPEDEAAICNDPAVLSCLGTELDHTPDPCGKIIRLFYYANATMEEIAEDLGFKNAETAKAKKSQCMTGLIKRVTEALHRAGFDLKPKNRNRNGKN